MICEKDGLKSGQATLLPSLSLPLPPSLPRLALTWLCLFLCVKRSPSQALNEIHRHLLQRLLPFQLSHHHHHPFSLSPLLRRCLFEKCVRMCDPLSPLLPFLLRTTLFCWCSGGGGVGGMKEGGEEGKGKHQTPEEAEGHPTKPPPSYALLISYYGSLAAYFMHCLFPHVTLFCCSRCLLLLWRCALFFFPSHFEVVIVAALLVLSVFFLWGCQPRWSHHFAHLTLSLLPVLAGVRRTCAPSPFLFECSLPFTAFLFVFIIYSPPPASALRFSRCPKNTEIHREKNKSIFRTSHVNGRVGEHRTSQAVIYNAKQ
jgi:hypothetical protein